MKITDNKRIIAVIAAVAVMLVTCLTAAGCGDFSQVMEQYSQMTNQEPEETLAPGQSIYDLSMFNDLPQDYSTIDPAFWIAEGNGGTVYFLGSIHCADRSSYRLPEKIMNAYLASDALAVECDIVAYEQNLQSNFMQQMNAAKDMMYMDGSTIKNHVSAETYNGLIDYWNKYGSSFASQGYTTSTMEKMKPAVWMSLFENLQIEQAGLDSELGIDSHLLKIAHAQGKQIIEIESVEFQNDLLFGFSDDINELLLSSYVSQPLEESAQYVYDSYKDWQIGDLDALMAEDEETDYSGYTQDEIDKYERLSEEYNNAMLYDRNIGMADKAAQMLDRGQNVFYVVGAAHMAGEKGIIAMLRDRGYTVTQIGGIGGDGSKLPANTNNITTAATTADTTTTAKTGKTTSAAYNAVYESQYDVYAELYEYFGGTTRPANGKTTRTAAPTTEATNTGNSNSENGWGGWGSSDGAPLGGRGIFD